MPADAIIIAIDKMSIACGCYQLRNLVKIARIHKSSSKEPQWRFKAELPPPEINALVSFAVWLRHNAFRSPRLQTFRRRSHSTVASQWDGNTAFTVHVAWYCTSLAIRAAIKSCLKFVVTQQWIWCWGKILGIDDVANSTLKWVDAVQWKF